MTKPLSAEDIATFERDGLVIPGVKLPDDLMSRIGAAVDQLVADNPQLKPEQLGNPHLPTELTDVHGSDDFLEFAAHPMILDAVEQLIGPDIILWSTHVFYKPPEQGMGIPWHQDGHAFPIKPVANVTMWIALDASTPENGCLQFIPGSHTHGLFKHDRVRSDDLAFSISVEPDSFDENDARCVELEPGQFSMHHVKVIHGSGRNRSQKRRAGFTLFYMPATSLYDRSVDTFDVGLPRASEHARRPIWLMRGQDRADNTNLIDWT